MALENLSRLLAQRNRLFRLHARQLETVTPECETCGADLAEHEHGPTCDECQRDIADFRAEFIAAFFADGGAE